VTVPEFLATDRHAIALEVVSSMDDRNVVSLRGDARARCLEDTEHHLEQLIAALEIEDPDEFVQYVAWVGELLAARGISAADVRTNLETIADVLRDRYGGRAVDAIEYVGRSISERRIS